VILSSAEPVIGCFQRGKPLVHAGMRRRDVLVSFVGLDEASKRRKAHPPPARQKNEKHGIKNVAQEGVPLR
jgi:hypothetical protein